MNMKTKSITLSIVLLFSVCVSAVFAKEIKKDDLIGRWDIQGSLMGDDGTGWLLPHKPANPDCEADHTIFYDNNTSEEVYHDKDCKASENVFEWKLNGNILTLTKGERNVKWHIKSFEEGKMIIGVQVRPNSENLMYVVYKKHD